MDGQLPLDGTNMCATHEPAVPGDAGEGQRGRLALGARSETHTSDLRNKASHSSGAMALEVRERFVEPVEKTVVTEPFAALLQSQERAILVRIEQLKAQGLEVDGLNILLYWVRSAQANLIG